MTLRQIGFLFLLSIPEPVGHGIFPLSICIGEYTNWLKLEIMLILHYSGNSHSIELHGFMHIIKVVILTDSLAFICKQPKQVLYIL